MRGWVDCFHGFCFCFSLCCDGSTTDGNKGNNRAIPSVETQRAGRTGLAAKQGDGGGREQVPACLPAWPSDLPRGGVGSVRFASRGLCASVVLVVILEMARMEGGRAPGRESKGVELARHICEIVDEWFPPVVASHSSARSAAHRVEVRQVRVPTSADFP
ncbi:hypothetical protein IWX47DRAFT_675053 [Phyllosticta citricarpa]